MNNTNLMDPAQFRTAWDEIDTTDDPREMREAFERDQEAEDDREAKREHQ